MAAANAQSVEAASSEAAGARNGFKVFHRILDWVSKERYELFNITGRIHEIVRQSGIRDGLVHLQSLHTTTAIFVNEWQDALLEDVRAFLANLVRADQYYRHNDPAHSDCERGNADAHLRGMLMGQTLCLQVRNASLLLGTWQSVIFAEFDGPRNRTLAVQVSGA